MQVFAKNSSVTLSFEMISQDGSDAITPISAVYSVYDEEGALVENQPVPVSGGEVSLDFTIDSTWNAVEGGRTAVLKVTGQEGVFTLSQTYFLESFSLLSVPSESAMTVPGSMSVRRSLIDASLETWDYASDTERRAALQGAWPRIASMPMKPWRAHETPPPDASYALRNGKFRLDEITKQDWDLLPRHFTEAVKRAQLLEACSSMDGESAFDRRMSGILSKTVGESSEMFTGKTPGVQGMSPEAYRQLRQYVVRKISIGRTS